MCKYGNQIESPLEYYNIIVQKKLIYTEKWAFVLWGKTNYGSMHLAFNDYINKVATNDCANFMSILHAKREMKPYLGHQL